MSSRCVSLLPWTTLHSDSEQVLHWHVKYEAMSCWGFFYISKATREPAGKAEIPDHDDSFLIINIQANRVAIVHFHYHKDI